MIFFLPIMADCPLINIVGKTLIRTCLGIFVSGSSTLILIKVFRTENSFNNFQTSIQSSLFGEKNNTGLFDWIINSKEKKIFGFTRAYYNGFTTLELSKIIFEVIKLNLPISGLYNLSSSKINKYRLLKIINKAFNLNKNIVKNTNFSCNRTLNSKLFFKKIKYKVPNWHKMISEMKLLKK